MTGNNGSPPGFARLQIAERLGWAQILIGGARIRTSPFSVESRVDNRFGVKLTLPEIRSLS
jgi:predicted permease